MDLHLSHGHVNVGGKDGKEEDGQAPAGEKLDLTDRDHQSGRPKQFNDSAD